MGPLQAIGRDVLGLDICLCVVPSAVLQHRGLYLCLWVGDAQIVVLDRHADLLMGIVRVDICVCCCLHADGYYRFYDHEAC